VKMVVTGLSELMEMFEEIAPNAAMNIGRAAVQSIASSMAKEIKTAAPKLKGDLKKTIRAQRKKSKRTHPKSMVRANAMKNSNGTVNTFYWKFQEYGSRQQPKRPFIGPVRQKYSQNMPQLMREHFGKKLEQHLVRQARKGSKLR
jgi:HK97 gp10 family phage protein